MISAIALVSLVLALAACGRSPPPPSTRARLVLDGCWDRAPWRDGAGAPGHPLVLRCRFTLPAERVTEAARLQLEGLWWSASVTLNRQAQGSVTGGNAPAVLALAQAPVAGDNTLELRISPPGPRASTTLTGGGLAASGFTWGAPTLQSPPILELMPEAHVTAASLPIRDGRLLPAAAVTGAPEGARVRFRAARDGDLLAELGEAPVVEGWARAPEINANLPRWRPGRPELFHLVTELLSPSAQVLDAAIVRTGVREVSVREGALWIGEAPLRLMAARLTNSGADPFERLRAWLPGGINAVEVHGELLHGAWLDAADELGLPFVVLPRCLGRCRDRRPLSAAERTTLAEQDARLVAHAGPHPAALLWVTEGPPPRMSASSLWTPALLEDPSRPVVDHHLPGRTLTYGGGGWSCGGGGCAGAWLAEITRRGPPTGGMWREMADAFTAALDQGAVGGTIQTPRDEELPRWAEVWSERARSLALTPLPTGDRRATSLVQVTGLPPGQTAWLSAPWAPTVGAVADASGVAELRAWHEGPATISASGWQASIRLSAGMWEDAVLDLRPQRVPVGAPPEAGGR